MNLRKNIQNADHHRARFAEKIRSVALHQFLWYVTGVQNLDFGFFPVSALRDGLKKWHMSVINPSKFTRNVEYVKYHEPIYRTIRKFVTATGSNDIDIAGFQISFPSMGVAVQRQRHDYTPSQFVSEIGGAAGLVLGASGEKY